MILDSFEFYLHREIQNKIPKCRVVEGEGKA